ncbi:MAG: glycoside hydrolase TIM-barrel-like domain-containing protein, partial [Hyphomicrobiaceae bacterium]
HLDREAGARSVYDLGYLAGNIFGGEGYDWFYATGADRAAQIRTPITDAAEGKAFVFRYKDIRSWWSSLHYDRPSGVEVSTPTAWVPASKPVWLTEIGCPAIDKGANQPNVFVDAKSSESFIPYFSSGARDDLMQRRYLQAMVEAFDPDSPGYVEGANPVSEIYGGPMLDLDHVHVYAWDARPYPAFPSNDLVWSDGESWRRGHWLNGRIASQPLDRVIGDILDGYDFPHYDVEGLEGLVAGLVLDRPMSAREALQPLELAHFLDAVESGGAIRFRHRADGPVRLALSLDDLVETRAGAELVRLTRAQETDLPAAARISYASLEDDYRHGVAQSRRLVGASGRLAEAQVALVMEAAEAQATAEIWLFEAWAARERASFTLPPSAIAIEPGDLVSLSHAGVSRLFRITEVGEQTARQMTALSVDPSVYTASSAVVRRQKIVGPAVTGPVLGIFLDLPLLTGAHAPEAGYVVASRVPWQGGAAFYRSPDDQGFELAARARHRATTGTTLDDLPPGPASRFDRAARLRVRLDAGTLISTEPSSLLAGANAAAVRSSSGEWEVLQFATATLVGPGIYELSTLLRGQAGSEAAMATTIPAGATFVLLDSAVTEVPLTRDEIGLPFNWRYGPATLDIGHLSFQSTSHAFRGVGLRPLSPVHIRGRRTAAGDLVVTWTRRTRIGGDSWASVEVPLGEEVEAYEVDILSGTSIVRTLVSGTTTVSYSAAEQSADFGAPQASVMVSIAQTSPAFGRGTSRAAVI